MRVATEHIATVEHPMQRHSIIHRKKTKKKNKSKATLFALLMPSLKLTNSHKCFNKKKKKKRERPREAEYPEGRWDFSF